MNNNIDKKRIQPKVLIRLAIITLVLLSVPLLMAVFDWKMIDPGSPEPESINWGVFDFLVMGMLIFGTGLAYELLKLRVSGRTNRIILAVVLLGLFVYIWAELAVGVFLPE